MDKITLIRDFGKAVARLESVLEVPVDSDLLRAGCIQFFEFSFELAWKTIQAFVSDAGLQDAVSPKSCLRHAFKLGWIDDEAVWLSMLESRNRMAHTYDAERALEIYSHLPSYAISLRQLVHKLQSLL